MLSRIFLTLLLAWAGGALFAWVHSPLPWLLGPLVTIVAAVFLGVTALQAPTWFRKAGLIVVGIALGLRITPQIWQTMSEHLGLMLLATIVTVCFGILNAWILHKWRNVDLVTSLFSNISIVPRFVYRHRLLLSDSNLCEESWGQASTAGDRS